MPVLISFCGLPGVGKTSIAKALCRETGATYVRVDVIEAALRASRLQIDPAEDAGYRAACEIAKSNLELGRSVVADTVNPVGITRDMWAKTALISGAELINVEIVCSDLNVHKVRVESRVSDIDGYPVPDWGRVKRRHYEEWDHVDLRLDSGRLSVADCVDAIIAKLADHAP